MSHDLGQDQTVVVDVETAKMWYQYHMRIDPLLSHNIVPTENFDPPIDVAGPQRVIMEENALTSASFLVTLYFTRRSIGVLEWATLLSRTSYGG